MHNSFSCMFISILYLFRTAMCPSSGELIVSIWHLVYVTLCRWPGMQVSCIPEGHLHRVTYSILYLFRTAMCPSSGELIVSIWHLVYVTLYRWPGMQVSCIPEGHLHRVTYSILYVFRTAMCPSSGELIVSIRHLVYVTLCRWPSGMQETCIPEGHLHTCFEIWGSHSKSNKTTGPYIRRCSHKIIIL